MPRKIDRFTRGLGGVIVVLFGLTAAGLTVWSLLALLGVVPPPAPSGKPLSPTELASMSVAGATLLLATATVSLAGFTGRSVALGHAELVLAENSLKAIQEQGKKQAEQVAATLEQVKVTQDQADIARRSLEAGWRPFLVDVPYGYAAPPTLYTGVTDAAVVEADKLLNGAGRVRVSLRNIGSGLAIITKADLSFGQLHAPATDFSSSIVAMGEVVRIEVEIQPEGAVPINIVSQIEARQPFIVTAVYTDQGGVNTWRSRAYFSCPVGQPGARYEIEKVELYAGDDIRPFATAGIAQSA